MCMCLHTLRKRERLTLFPMAALPILKTSVKLKNGVSSFILTFNKYELRTSRQPCVGCLRAIMNKADIIPTFLHLKIRWKMGV